VSAMSLAEPISAKPVRQVEFWADAAVHALGVPLGALAGAHLLARSVPLGPVVLLANLVYVIGLIGMLTASAAYQMAPWGPLKERLRRFDKAMIFVMIAGTYTPISTITLYGRHGVELALIVWAMAAGGIAITLRYPRRFETALFALYFAMSYMLLLLIHSSIERLAPFVLALLISGGLTYTIGAAIRARRRTFHTPVWHILVLLAAAQHYAAIAIQLTGRV
jgi:hemolysin III